MAGTPTLTNVDLDQLSVLVGPIIVDGFAEGEALRIEFNDDQFVKYVGAGGQVSRAKTNDLSARITIRLMQGSATNDDFSKLFLSDLSLPNGAGQVPFFVRDRGGRSLYTASHIWCVKWPDVAHARDPGEREWMFDAARLIMLVGGN